MKKTAERYVPRDKTETYKKYLSAACKYIICFALMAALCNAQINGERPFGLGAYVALAFCGQNIAIISLAFIGAQILAEPTVQTLVVSLCAAAVITVSVLFHFKIKREANFPLIVCYALISQIAYIYDAVVIRKNAIGAAASIALGMVFLFACLYTARTVLVKKLKFRLNKNDCAAIAFIVIALGAGLYSYRVMDDTLLKLVFVAVMLILVYAPATAAAMCFSVCLGVGAAIAGGGLNYAAAFCAIAITASLFSGAGKFYPSAAVIVCETVLGLHFDAYGGYTLSGFLAVAAGAAIFLAMPDAFIASVKEAVMGSGQSVSAKHLINRNRNQLNARLSEMVNAFGEMEQIFRAMSQGAPNPPDAVENLTQRIPMMLCSSCAGSIDCMSEARLSTEACHRELVSRALSKGKINIIDVPEYISNRCLHINALISAVNELADGYRRQKEISQNVSNARILVADQFRGVSTLLKNMAKDIGSGVNFDRAKEEEISEELTYYDVICREVMLSVEAGMIYTVSLVVKNGTYDFSKLKSAVGRVLKSHMAVVSQEETSMPGWDTVMLKTAPKYDVVFGSAQECKAGSKVCGDTHSFTKIGEDKFLIALCDGMGSGDAAKRLSATALSLVENFYRAKFDNDTIISSVNSLLTVNSDDSFSALDICVLDLRRRTADFIKLGAPYGALKHGGFTECISAGSLPLGILEDIKPVSFTKELRDNDMVVLATDGITDLFDDAEEFCSFVNSINTLNPQSLAQEIIEKCSQFQKGAPQDDMSVLVARIFPLV